jgi:glycerol kinase
VTRAHVVRAAGVAGLQGRDVVETMAADAGRPIHHARRRQRRRQLMRFQADVLGTTVDREVVETALGAAMLAGLGVGLWSQADLARVRAVGRVFAEDGGRGVRRWPTAGRPSPACAARSARRTRRRRARHRRAQAAPAVISAFISRYAQAPSIIGS